MPSSTASPARVRRNDALCALRREEILDAAIKLFGRKGFDATRAEGEALYEASMVEDIQKAME